VNNNRTSKGCREQEVGSFGYRRAWRIRVDVEEGMTHNMKSDGKKPQKV